MRKYLVIVESPAKARTIGEFLGEGYIVKSSMGHVRDLPVRRLGVDISNDFKPAYEIVKGRSRIVREIKSLAAESQGVYIATDNDREGEAIGWHLVNISGIRREEVKRIVFHEITKDVIEESLKSPGSINIDMVNAQQARRILDRLVGYKISPLLSTKVRRGLSAGRVQSVAVRLIVEREVEIRNFVPAEYWTIYADLEKSENMPAFRTTLYAASGKPYEKLGIKTKDEADEIIGNLSGASYEVTNVAKKVKKRSPFPPFITSTLQQEAYWKLGFSARKTMMIAQHLYEGIRLGDEMIGIITYMRTDSFNVAETARQEALKYIEQRFGDSFLPEKPRIYRTKVKMAQEAHESIRPTSVRREPEEARKYLTDDEFNLYRLIWGRFVASQMSSAVFDTVSADIKAGSYLFRATGQKIIFAGFMKIYGNEENDAKQESLPDLQVGENLKLERLGSEQHFTQPPSRYNEGSLIKTMEEYGIGRPSTYAPIIGTILERGYVELKKKQFVSTEIGNTVNGLLVKYFPDIVNIDFTAHMESDLDEIAVGTKSWVAVLKEFYEPFEKTLKNAYERMEYAKPRDIPTDETCPDCNAPLVIKEGRYGKFLACTGFPRCRYSARLDENDRKEIMPVVNEKCEKCGSAMVVRKGRRGNFIACSGYPRCRNTRSLPVGSGK